MNDDDSWSTGRPVQASVDEAHARSLSVVFRSVFDALDEAFCVIEMIFDAHGEPADFRFVEVNRAFAKHTGIHDAMGKTIRELLPDIDDHWIERYGHVVRTGEPVRFSQEGKALGRWFDLYAFPLGSASIQRVGIHFTDITERKRTEDELRHRGEQFHALIEQAPIGVFVVDANTRLIEVNPAARPVFGVAQDLIGRDFGEVMRIMWPERLADEVLAIFRQTLETGVPYHDPELAEVRADRGVTEYYDWRVDRILLPDGTFGVVCYFTDVSAQVWARTALARSEERYRTLFESIDEGFCIVHVIFDEDERPIDYRFVEVNPAFVRHTGLRDALGRTVLDLVPEIEPYWIEAYGRVALTGEPTRFVEYAKSMGRWFDDYAFRIGEPHEHRVAVLFNDITERKRAEHALQESVALLRHHAHHDALTGLPNRVLFEDRLRLAIADAERHGRPFAVLFLDLDGFKAINDELGHASGDVVLTTVARRLRRSLRAGDTLARIHGDEFVALLPELSDPLEAGTLAHDLLAVVDRPIDVAGTTVTVHASIGVSLCPDDGVEPRTLLRAADAAMYRAKLGGKNTVSYVVPSSDGDGATAVHALEAGQVRSRHSLDS
jgi:diguanylate cyclase (GGDEF)-like protein/PAS domain S-box-containing protein